MRIPILVKIFCLVIVILTGALAAVLFSTQNIFRKDKSLFIEELSTKLSTGLVSAAAAKIENVETKLAIFVSNYQSLSSAQKADKNLGQYLFQQYPEFVSIGMLEWRNASWSKRWSVRNPNSFAVSWPANFESKLYQELHIDTLRVGSVWFLRQSTPQLGSVFSAVFRVEVQENGGERQFLVVGTLAPNSFESLVTSYKEALNEGFIVDSEGVAIAYPSRKFVGLSLKKHAVVKDIVEKQKMAGKGDHLTNFQGEEVVYSFKKIPRTNLYAIVTTPKGEAFSAADELFLNLLIIGAAVALISLMVIFIFTRLITSPLAKLKKVASQIGGGNFHVPVDVQSSDEVGDLSNSIKKMLDGLIERDDALEHSKKALIQSEKMSAFGQLSAGIAHEVKNPLAGILGHAQLARGKAKSEDMVKHIQFIEKETKRTKEIIENLMKFARQEKLELEPTNLYDTVSTSVDLVDHQLSLMGVKIHKHLQEVGPILGQSNQIQQVLLNLMMNAGHAMEGREEKRLDVYLEPIDEKIAQVRIKDTGSGMPKEVRDRIFEPFFTTKPSGKGTGLGLSVSVGIVEDHNANIRVESEEGKGTCFFIDFPVNKEIEMPASQVLAEEIEVSPEDDVLKKADAVLQEDMQKAEDTKESDIADLEAEALEARELSETMADMPTSPSEMDLHSSRDYLMKEKGISNIQPRHKVEGARKEEKSSKSEFKVKIRKPKTK